MSEHRYLCHVDGSDCEDGCDRAADPVRLAAYQSEPEPDQATTLPGSVMVALVAVYHFQRTRGLYLLTSEALQYVPPNQRVTPIPTREPDPEPDHFEDFRVFDPEFWQGI